MKTLPTQSRRQFLRSSGLLTIGFSLLPGCYSDGGQAPATRGAGQELPGSLSGAPRIDSWLQVLDDGRVRVFTGKHELGQGIRTAITQVAAEELYTRPALVEVHLAETGVTPDEGYTAGSRSIEQSAMAVRYAAAAAAARLRALAAERWGAEAERLRLADGQVVSADGQNSLSFAELLAGRQLEGEVTLPVPLKPKEEYRWVGQPLPRVDVVPMITGAPYYVHDLRFPEMVFARVVRPPGYGAGLEGYDEGAVRQDGDGVLQIVRDGSFLAVLAESEYQAIRAQQRLRAHSRWSAPRQLPADRPLKDHLKSIASRTEQVEQEGRIFGEPAKKLRASYSKPYVMHGAMGPSCAVARYDNESLDIWTHSQGVYPLRRSLAAMLSMPEERIHLKAVPGAGCYGHNGADDVAAEAALLARALPGRHVHLQWSREEENAWEPYGSAMIMELEAGLNGEGRIDWWKYDLWSDTHSTRPGGDAAQLLPARYLAGPAELTSSGYLGGAYRNAPPYYAIGKRLINAHFFEGPLRVSALRSLGAYANIFAIESFMDELAELAGADPLDFRIAHSDDARAVAVLTKLRELCAGQTTAADEGIGYAFSRYKNSAAYCGVAARVRVDPGSGAVRLQQLWAAIDAGEVINPEGLRNQTEGGMLQSASWTLLEAVGFDTKHVTTLNWPAYPVLRFSDAPRQIEVAVIDRPDQPCLGAGEAAQGPTAAAIANAVYRASGKRIRDLPIRKG